MYDYGNSADNKNKYGENEPPLIHVQDIIEVPIMIWCAEDDEIATCEDAEWLFQEIKKPTRRDHEGTTDADNKTKV